MMVKRKEKNRQVPPPAPPQIEEHNLERGVDATTTPYEVGSWSGLPQYRCLLCKFDTLNEDTIFKHIEETHQLGKQQSPSVLVADKRGNDVTDQVSSEGDLNGMFEIELKEVSSTTDEQGNEHKTFTIKE